MVMIYVFFFYFTISRYIPDMYHILYILRIIVTVLYLSIYMYCICDIVACEEVKLAQEDDDQPRILSEKYYFSSYGQLLWLLRLLL